MKKKIVLSLLLASTLVVASDYKYEVSPMVGYNIAEGNLEMKDDGYFIGGLEAQANTLGSKLSPELSVFHSHHVDYNGGGNTNITRGAMNGVYTFNQVNSFIPFAKMGVGIENISNEQANNNTGMFVDAGAGLKVPFAEHFALKLEATYMAKINSDHAGNADSNLVALAGLTYSFGAQEQKPAPTPAPVVKAAPVDNDHDGVIDSEDNCLNTPANTKVDASGCAVPIDSDGDGVYDASDKCPNTVAGSTVDVNGCAVDLDDDNDGVKNSVDKCPNTPAGAAVNVDGCPAIVNLHINFANNSAEIAAVSDNALAQYAKFLTDYPNYSANIVGYTDSRGSASYNQKLSQKRAEAVVKALVKRGVKPSQLKSSGMGEANPIADNATADGRAQNRRIEAELTRN